MSETADSPSLRTPRALQRLLSRLLLSHSPEALRAATLELWARGVEVDLGRSSAKGVVAEWLAASRPESTEALRRELGGDSSPLVLKEVEGMLEALMDPEHRRGLGVVYTPDYIIDALLEGVLEQLGPLKRPPLLVDPFVGGAGFLLRAARLWKERFGIGAAESFSELLVGFDLDPLALLNARAVVELYLLQQGEDPAAASLRLLRADTLLTPAEDLWQRAGAPAGFPLLVTNPPYVKLQNLSEPYRRELSHRYPEFAGGSFSLAMLAPVALHRLLAPGGAAAMITQNNLFTSLSAERLRRYLSEAGALRRILDFGSQQIFSSASAYTCLLFLGREGRDFFEYEMLRRPASAATLREVRYSSFPTASLRPRKWRLAPAPHHQALEAIERTGLPLAQLADIRVGYATLKDQVFELQEREGRTMGRGGDGEWMEVEEALARPALKVSTLRAEADLLRNRERVLFPYEKVEGKYRVLEEEKLRTRFPLAYRYLSSHQDALRARDRGRKPYPAWYAWGRTQGMEAPGPKLLTKTFSQGPRFYLDPSDQLFRNGYALALSPRGLREGLTLPLLQRLLNSRVMHYYATLSSVHLTGGYQCYQKNFIEGFGIPVLSASDREALEALEGRERERYIASLYALSLEEVEAYLEEMRHLGEAEEPPAEEEEGA